MCFTDYIKAFDYVDFVKLWNVLRNMRIIEDLIVHVRSIYTGQEAIVQTEHGETDSLQFGKRVKQWYILSIYLFILYAEYILKKARLEKHENGFKIERNINNLRYADNSFLITENAKDLQAIVKQSQGTK